MSSFVIAKEEYIKAAAFCAALADTKNYYREPMLRIWNYKDNRVMTDADYITSFTALYKINAESVRRQYKDENAENDINDYADTFNAVKAHIKREIKRTVVYNGREFVKYILEFSKFCNSVFYQIEDLHLLTQARYFLNDIRGHLLDLIAYFDGFASDDLTSWGAFDIMPETGETSAA